jgi:hypothetical protein
MKIYVRLKNSMNGIVIPFIQNWILLMFMILFNLEDSSLCCTIKRSLRDRMNISKTFILIVGNKTNIVTKGSCQYCAKYKKIIYGRAYCQSSNNIDSKSFIKYECELAIKNNLNIVVLYNSNIVNKQLCPEIIRLIGIHVPMKVNGAYCYSNVRDAIMKAENN